MASSAVPCPSGPRSRGHCRSAPSAGINALTEMVGELLGRSFCDSTLRRASSTWFPLSKAGLMCRLAYASRIIARNESAICFDFRRRPAVQSQRLLHCPPRAGIAKFE